MNYQKSAQELLSIMISSEQNGDSIQPYVSELVRGELAVLIFLLDGHNGASANDISRKFQINTSRVAAILNSLCKKGYAVRQKHPADRRKIRVYATESGREFALLRRDEVLGHICCFLKKLGEEDAKEHIRIMRKIMNILN
ncbi:MarR family winged helix-turn-helix transcriptional regulator [Ructibacterium gallinarum]|uniref:Winged helix-turn-helix transcriptional regulator n=1 Tax=Ructibacterium gallinarum TaxID=2779355 RepID=A0A9D5LYY0_9FIRM|nr:MarR family winged helix-turn-helix transcriptional regulator [Ructibacterium gallinarum]MBE5040591.1 winged helix-turn-helix transcriptional regulator [Ructibacterium gallinarum]